MASPTVKKALQTIRRRGPLQLGRTAFRQLAGTAIMRMRMIGHPQFDNFDALLDFSSNAGFGVIRPIQVRSEIRRLLELLQNLKPRQLMEIGTANGGTLFLFPRVAAHDATTISLDLPGGAFGGGYPLWKRGLYRSFALPGQHIELVRADSHQPATKEKIASLCNGKPLDFLLIDGDHTYEGVRADFEMYAPMVRPGGLIAFHDISPFQNDPKNHVGRFWNEIKGGYQHEEIMGSPEQDWAGIGVLYQR